jgi:predicted esterase YcpF (UPF0227 family)
MESQKSGENFQALLSSFGHHNVVELDYSWREPDKGIDDMLTRIDSSQQNIIVGSSLGGFFANILAQKTGSSLLVINPAFLPRIMLPDLPSGYDNYSFIEIDQPMITLLSKNDELFKDYWQDYEALYGDFSQIVMFENTSHRFENKASIVKGVLDVETSSYFQ